MVKYNHLCVLKHFHSHSDWSYCTQCNVTVWTSVIHTIWKSTVTHLRRATRQLWEIIHLKMFNIAILSPVWVSSFFLISKFMH
jgi:hypothetical protein